MTKKMNILNLILTILVLILDVFYIIFNNAFCSLAIKSSASILFVLIGLINLIFSVKQNKKNIQFSSLLFAGLFFAMLGDILLEIMFTVGAILFAIGHVLYFISYCNITKFKWKDLLYGLAIFVFSFSVIVFVPVFNFGGVLMEIVCIAYALIISLMVGKAISNYVQTKTKLSLVILVGSCLFYFSDFMLVFNVFADISEIFGVLCLSTYYPAEILLAYSILFCSNVLNVDKT